MQQVEGGGSGSRPGKGKERGAAGLFSKAMAEAVETTKSDRWAPGKKLVLG